MDIPQIVLFLICWIVVFLSLCFAFLIEFNKRDNKINKLDERVEWLELMNNGECHTCRWLELSSPSEPCYQCTDENNKWEPKVWLS